MTLKHLKKQDQRVDKVYRTEDALSKEFHGLSEITRYTGMNGEEEEEEESGGIYSVESGEEILKSGVIRRDEEIHDAGGHKPIVGSEEWHRVRRSNHKEVERRRRETINESISELSRIVPGCEKNKGKILERTVSYIQQLKENEANNIEKWTLEKLLTDQAISELSATNQKLKAECDRLWREVSVWKQAATCGINNDKDEKKDDPISNVRAEKMD
ncbi:hypothetical protein T552_00183 [Pneumocystis carinii B80]|uniref:BHLH domain-containing protein n=1 Tax=Pneumocystis carinii (strain B80) TaxID=1408658 RepID=A0A0W4ZT53_PNEC8|nr:hypothetical protein T552_00183 [Pneumocystis carinii B80]KTW31541.1 hypothetical protein T552_00183 [Pneumocystis carinii B80]